MISSISQIISIIVAIIISIAAAITIMGLNLSDIKDIATVFGVVIAAFTLWLGVSEYIRQGKQKRAEHFFNLRKKWKENVVFKKIRDLIESDDTELINTSLTDKYDYLGLFEEIAIMKNSGLIKSEVTYYMFGYYAVMCWKSTNFWDDKEIGTNCLNRDGCYWKVFVDFAKDCMIFDEKENNFNSKKITI